MNELLIAKNEALADIDYYIHEIEENGLSKKLVKELEKAKPLLEKANSLEAVAAYLAIYTSIFQKAFQ
jgi:hypothetical protein